MRFLAAIFAITWAGLWFTPDQEGRRLFQREEYVEAAEAFRNPMWKGASYYRAGDFKRAAAAFSRLQTPEGFFNKGDALVMLGNYDAAIEAYGKALEKRPGWKEASDNLELAKARAKRKQSEGGDLGDQREGADQIVFDKKKNNEGQDTDVSGDKASDPSTVQAMWLRKVTSKPADFLKAKFSWQYQETKEDTP